MKYFISCTRNGGTCYIYWEGQTQEQVNLLLINLGAIDIQSIDEDTYNIAVQAFHSRNNGE